MKDIKFKVWDNVNYMSQPFTLLDIQSKQIQFTSDCIVLRFTGLKDKNGTEIYEGDILKTWYSRDTTGKDIIEYHYEVEHEINSYNGKSGFQIDFLQNCEVVGNIYETPHLMISEQSPERIVETDAKSRLWPL